MSSGMYFCGHEIETQFSADALSEEIVVMEDRTNGDFGEIVSRSEPNHFEFRKE